MPDVTNGRPLRAGVMLDEPRVGSRRTTCHDGPRENEHGILAAATIAVALEPLPPHAELAERWHRLESRADCTFFTSWAWIGAWLATNKDADAALISGSHAGREVALAVVTRGRAQGLVGALGRRRLALHQRADGKDAALFVEYNDVLTDRDYARAARIAVVQFLVRSSFPRAWSWGELKMPGLVPAAASVVRHSSMPIEERSRECAWVDFARAGQDYLATLSRNTRAQVRRAIRIAEADGAIALTPACGVEQRLRWLAELRALHQDSWRRLRSQPGAFAAPEFSRFVETLARDGGDAVELLRITAGGTTIGLLLNFVFRGHVYAYQSGLAYRDDNRFKPGLICHTQAIVHSARAGRAGYHFMAGESRYKTSLATALETLTWVTLRRRGALTAIEQSVSSLKERLKAALYA